MNQKPRILAYGDYGSSGLGIALREPMKRLHNMRLFDIALLGVGYDSWNEDPENYPFKVFPTATDLFPRGSGLLARAVHQFQPDFLFSNLDVGWLDVITHPEFQVKTGAIKERYLPLMSLKTRKFKHIGYSPIDGFCIDNMLPRGFKEILSNIDYRVTYSQWTSDVLKSHGIECSANIYHGIDPKVYFAIDKKEVRKELIPEEKLSKHLNSFIVQMVATNQHRKRNEDLIIAFAEFAKDKKDVSLWLHTNFKLQRNHAEIGAHDLLHLIEQVGIEDRIINSSPLIGCPDEVMNKIYNAADIGVLLTEGEGFGLPIIHYHAVSKPILTTDCTACSELLIHDDEKLPILYSYIAHTNNLERYGTDLEVLVDRLNYFYYQRNRLEEVGIIGRQDIMNRFDYERVIMPQWIDFWDKVCIENGFPSIK